MATSKPVLFSYFRSSCSWRVRIALAHKGIEYDYEAINLLTGDQVRDSFKKINPMGQVPALLVNGQFLTQSQSILEFLEETHPDKPLLPKDSIKRAKVREVCALIASGIQPIQNLAVLKYVGDEKKVEWAKHWITQGFIALEKLLQNCAGTYCVGDELSIADCCLVPQVFNANRFQVDMKDFPMISRINETLSGLEAFKKAHPSNQPDCPADLK